MYLGGVLMPVFDFFWKACRTYTTAFQAEEVDTAVSVTVMVIHDLQNTRANALERFGTAGLLACLCEHQGGPDVFPDLDWEVLKVLP